MDACEMCGRTDVETDWYVMDSNAEMLLCEPCLVGLRTVADVVPMEVEV